MCVHSLSSSTLCESMDFSSTRAPPAHGILQGKNTGMGYHSFLQEIFPTRIKPVSPALLVDCLPSETPKKPSKQVRPKLGFDHLKTPFSILDSVLSRPVKKVVGRAENCTTAAGTFSYCSNIPPLSIFGSSSTISTHLP